jgi:hypothetical protein
MDASDTFHNYLKSHQFEKAIELAETQQVNVNKYESNLYYASLWHFLKECKDNHHQCSKLFTIFQTQNGISRESLCNASLRLNIGNSTALINYMCSPNNEFYYIWENQDSLKLTIKDWNYDPSFGVDHMLYARIWVVGAREFSLEDHREFDRRGALLVSMLDIKHYNTYADAAIQMRRIETFKALLANFYARTNTIFELVGNSNHFTDGSIYDSDSIATLDRMYEIYNQHAKDVHRYDHYLTLYVMKALDLPLDLIFIVTDHLLPPCPSIKFIK